MKRVLITGATGNTGYEIVRYLYQNNTEYQIVAGIRNIEKSKQIFKNFSLLSFVEFDFENSLSFDTAFRNIDCVFLLRPPHISDVNKYFKPLIEAIQRSSVTQIVFLSVQGVEKSSIIPHNKIEKLVKQSGIDYIFVRPSYFMQNLTTTLYNDIKEQRKIMLPAGKSKFNWIDVENIGETIAILITNFEIYKNKGYDVTGSENESFFSIVETIYNTLNVKIEYDNANIFRYYHTKKKEGVPKGMILVMIMLHFVPRFQKEPIISNFFKELTGKEPTTIKEFLNREKEYFFNI